MAMKGLVVLKGARERKRRSPDVNVTAWAREAAADIECQERVDTKAFTGRGKHLALRQEVDRLERLEGQMRDLVAASRAVPGLQIAFMLHVRKESGYTFLRWRERGVSKRHLSFEDAAEVWANYSGDLRHWCEVASSQAKVLNDEHKQCREELRSLREKIGENPAPVLPRSPLAGWR